MPHKVLKTTLGLEVLMPALPMKVRFKEVKRLPSSHRGVGLCLHSCLQTEMKAFTASSINRCLINAF